MHAAHELELFPLHLKLEKLGANATPSLREGFTHPDESRWVRNGLNGPTFAHEILTTAELIDALPKP
jgi:hypothetical protein